MHRLLAPWMRQTDAQDIIEYALLAAGISICAVVTLLAIGADVNSAYRSVNTASAAAASPDKGASPAHPGGNPGGGNGNQGGGNGNQGGGKGRQ